MEKVLRQMHGVFATPLLGRPTAGDRFRRVTLGRMDCGKAAAASAVAALVGVSSAQPARQAQTWRHASVSGNPVRDCTVAEVHQLVARFIRAFNAGASGQLGTLWAKDDHDGDAGTPSFQWYSTGKPGARLGREAEDRSTLIRYFQVRHRRGERLGLVSMSLGGNANGYFHFGFRIRRQARDMRRPGVFEGKGAAICSSARAQLAVWSVGPRVSGS
jgi:hypothetical protein